ncbi:MAG: hypothetical protein U0359_03485 [Byssovorax sp.]
MRELVSPSTESTAIPALPSRRRRWSRVLGAVAALLAIAVALVPIIELDVGTTRARACIAAYEEARSEALPDCRREIPWFVLPSRVPWTATPARYRAEELSARAAVMAYADALVGKPDPRALPAAAAALDVSAETLRRGSQRLALEELGRAVGAPNLGRAAALYGDRQTLLAHFDRWDEWNQRKRALDAALMEGDIPRALTIARRYADFDPRDEDLRTEVAAALCLGDSTDAARGAKLFPLVQDERAEHKHESWSRNWGEVRAVMVACALRGGVAPAPRPARADAGQADAEEVRAALRLRAATRGGGGGAEPSERRDASLALITTLGQPRSPGARARLLALLLASGYELEPKSAAELAKPMTDAEEPPVLVPPALTAIDWLDERCLDDGLSAPRVERCPGPRGLSAQVEGPALEEGAARLRKLAAEPGLDAIDVAALRAAATAASTYAAQRYASAGDADLALGALSAAGEGALSGAAGAALARANALHVAGQHARALAEVERFASAPPAGTEGPGITAALRIERAEAARRARQARRGRARRGRPTTPRPRPAGDRSCCTRAGRGSRWPARRPRRSARAPLPRRRARAPGRGWASPAPRSRGSAPRPRALASSTRRSASGRAPSPPRPKIAAPCATRRSPTAATRPRPSPCTSRSPPACSTPTRATSSSGSTRSPSSTPGASRSARTPGPAPSPRGSAATPRPPPAGPRGAPPSPPSPPTRRARRSPASSACDRAVRAVRLRPRSSFDPRSPSDLAALPRRRVLSRTSHPPDRACPLPGPRSPSEPAAPSRGRCSRCSPPSPSSSARRAPGPTRSSGTSARASATSP